MCTRRHAAAEHGTAGYSFSAYAVAATVRRSCKRRPLTCIATYCTAVVLPPSVGTARCSRYTHTTHQAKRRFRYTLHSHASYGIERQSYGRLSFVDYPRQPVPSVHRTLHTVRPIEEGVLAASCLSRRSEAAYLLELVQMAPALDPRPANFGGADRGEVRADWRIQ